MALLAPAGRKASQRISALARFTRSPLDVLEALTTPHGVDRYLELVNPMLTVRELRAEITDVRRHAHATTLTLRPTRQWRGFQSGQYVQVAIDIDAVRHTRCYSPASSEHRGDGRFELTVKAHDLGRVSQYLHSAAEPGLVVGLSQAEGSFTIPTRRPERIVFISGGSGITPVLSMLRTLCDEGYDGDIAFLHYAPTAEHVGYEGELRAITRTHSNVRAAVIHTQADTGDLAGRFGVTHLEEVAPWHDDAEIYVCGPDALMTAVRDLYDNAGIGERVHTEAFTLAPIVADDGQVTGEVSFGRSDIAAPNTGATLLEQAEAAGLRPEHGCRMGICFSCTQIKKSGCTRNVRTGELDSDPDTEIQLCINVPVGDVAIDV